MSFDFYNDMILSALSAGVGFDDFLIHPMCFILNQRNEIGTLRCSLLLLPFQLHMVTHPPLRAKIQNHCQVDLGVPLRDLCLILDYSRLRLFAIFGSVLFYLGGGKDPFTNFDFLLMYEINHFSFFRKE